MAKLLRSRREQIKRDILAIGFQMICRLCLRTLSEEYAIALFENAQMEKKLVKLIAKYFQLEITQDDQISTSICEDCNDHLEEFHKFWVYVDLKQSSLSGEFLAVKCSEVKADSCNEFELSGCGEDNAADSQGEILLDLKDIPAIAQDDACASGVNDLALPLEQISVTPDIKIDMDTDDEVDADAESTKNLHSYKDDNSSIDDDVPLLSLKDKSSKTISKPRKFKLKNHARVKKIKRRPKPSETEATTTTTTNTEAARPKTKKAKLNEEIIGSFMLLSCDLCNSIVNNYTELRSHFIKVHKRPAYVKCCNNTFHKPNSLAEHVQWHTDPSKFKCDLCGKNLRSSKSLAGHKKIIHKKKEVDKEIVHCHICSKGFRSQKCLDNHIEKHKYEKDYPCEICNKRFANSSRLRKHIEDIHENLQRHICDVCGKTFKFKPSFERHVLEHQGIIDPPVQCDICGEWSKNKHVNRLHQFRHSQIDTECKYCGRKCISRTALRGHIRYMHKKKFNLQCSLCEKTFKETRNLENTTNWSSEAAEVVDKEHMATHTGTQLYSCPHCSKECRSRSNMYVHIKRMHVNEWIQSKVARSNDPNLKASLANIS